MKKLKVLNLYAGIGGNRKLWEDVEVTAVELDPEIAKIYQSYFPDDTVIVGDAHQYLLDHFKEFDFIWASPPCPTHSRINTFATTLIGKQGYKKLEYPDMKLYQEVILLKQFCRGNWVIENVIPYYEPLIPGQKIDRHLFWANFKIGYFTPQKKKLPHMKAKSSISYLEDFFGVKLNGFSGDKRQTLQNCVHPETGLYILNCARNIITKSNIQQLNAFDI